MMLRMMVKAISTTTLVGHSHPGGAEHHQSLVKLRDEDMRIHLCRLGVDHHDSITIIVTVAVPVSSDPIKGLRVENDNGNPILMAKHDNGPPHRNRVIVTISTAMSLPFTSRLAELVADASVQQDDMSMCNHSHQHDDAMPLTFRHLNSL